MGLHRNARLGLAGRRALVGDVEGGLSCRAAARRRGVSPTTACKWWRRWCEATLEQRLSGVCLEDRSSRPRRSPRLLPTGEQARICAARRRSGWGPRLLYFPLFESSARQGTFGKQICGLAVTDTRGQRISFGRALGRYFAKFLSALVLGIGFLMVAFTPRKRGLHDLIAGTLVVRR